MSSKLRHEGAHVRNRALLVRLQAGDKKAEGELIGHFEVYVHRQAKRWGHWVRNTDDYYDICQEIRLALVHAARKFDLSRDTTFLTYAVWWIKAFVARHILRAHGSFLSGTSKHARAIFFRLGATEGRLKALLGAETVTDEMIAAELSTGEYKLTAEHVRDVRDRMAYALSLNRKIRSQSNEMEIELQDIIVDHETVSADEQLAEHQQTRQLERAVAHALAAFSPREQDIIRNRFMREPKEPLEAIGLRWGVTRERCRQLETRAKPRLALLLAAVAAQGQGEEK